MKFAPMLTALTILLFAWQPASAEFYRYVDKHGNVLYTDDLSNIPADQREQAKSFDEFKSAAPPAGSSVQEKASSKEEPSPDEANVEWQQLKKEREKLDGEYNDLKAERTKLDDAKKNAVTPEQIKSYNEQIVEYNTRATALQQKFDAHDEKVRAYNEKVKTKSAPPEKK